ncbi:CCHC-type zinc finger, nucleic acid binding protein b isoform X2 [Brachyhypopomus gauderio]|uniref:CCHC-type zinc finger, nucleic acid binding protein b isoform X2 n=1 Tax=Brachyhypopomus gauderio TaxID=698409 RepID=UPI004042D33E
MSPEDPLGLQYRSLQVKPTLCNLCNVCKDLMMSANSFKDHCDWSEMDEPLLGQGEDKDNIVKPKCGSEDVFSVRSASPCLGKLTAAVCDTKLTEWILCQSDMSGTSNSLHRVPPLESIREIVEEPGEHRDRQDRTARLKGQVASKEMFPAAIIRYMSVTQDGGADTLEQTLLEEVMECTTQPNDAHLENPMTDACSSVLDMEAESMLQEDIANVAINKQQVEWSSSSVCNELVESTEHKLSLCDAKSAVLEDQIDNQPSVTPPRIFQDPKNGHVCPQTAVRMTAKISDKLEECPSHISEKEDTVTSVANQTLVEILTACKAKVEHLEQVKVCSFDLSHQLQSARALAAQLNQRVLSLEHECGLKEKELQELSATLAKTSKTLQARNSEMASVNKELHQLQFELEANKKMAVPTRAIMANGKAGPNSQKRSLQNSSSSKLCTLF